MQLDAKEKEEQRFAIDEAVFPFKAKCPGKEYVCENYKDVAEMLTNPIGGVAMIKHVNSLFVETAPKKWKPILLASIANNPLIAHYMIDYSKANSPYVKSHLFTGDLQDQPNIYYGNGQGFDTIRNAISECEIENVRVSKLKANNGNH